MNLEAEKKLKARVESCTGTAVRSLLNPVLTTLSPILTPSPQTLSSSPPRSRKSYPHPHPLTVFSVPASSPQANFEQNIVVHKWTQFRYFNFELVQVIKFKLTIVCVFTIIYNCHRKYTLGCLLSLQSVLAMFLTKDILIYYRGLRPHRRGIVISVDPIPMTTAVFIVIETPITPHERRKMEDRWPSVETEKMR